MADDLAYLACNDLKPCILCRMTTHIIQVTAVSLAEAVHKQAHAALADNDIFAAIASTDSTAYKASYAC